MLTQCWVLDESFIKEVYNLKNYLSKLKIECEKFEQKRPSKTQIIEFINNAQKEAFARIDNSLEKLWHVVRYLPREPYKYYQIFAQKYLLPYFSTPPLNSRIHEKPLGYDGDYMMMNYYYQDEYEGDALFDILMHRYTLHIPIAKATTNRFKYFNNQIIATVQSLNGEKRITSIGSGSGNEVVEYIRNSNGPGNITITCIDAEPMALEEMKQKLALIPKQTLSKYKLNLLNYNILKYIKAAKKSSILNRQHLIYASGLFDYLIDKVARKLIEVMYSMLEVDGKLIISNFNKSIPSKAYMELLGEWYLILRDQKDLVNLCSGLGKNAKIDPEVDRETNTLIYLTIRKNK